MDQVNEMKDQLDMIKTRAMSIASIIQDFEVYKMMDDCELAELIESIQIDYDTMAIHIERASDLIDWDKTI